MQKSTLNTKETIESKFNDFILNKNHPCVMAQSVFTDDNYEIKRYPRFGSKLAAAKILDDLKGYLKSYDAKSNKFFTFIAVFDSGNIKNELTFELLLWQQLQAISDLDKKPWDRSVSSNPKDDQFSFSILGKAFYIIGMHPKSSRAARQTPFPCMVFNLHSQFEELRKMNAYKQVRNRIRKRDKVQNGSTNPMLVDFGHGSEAKQYSGREVDEQWECPFKHKK